MFLSSETFAQGTPGWLSADRFTFTLSSAYHFNPWDEYNQAMSNLSRFIALDILFYEPTGFYEKILGDASFRGTVGYDLSDRWQIILIYIHTHVASRFELEPDLFRYSLSDQYSVNGPYQNQNMTFRAWSLILGIRFHTPIYRSFGFQASGGIGWTAGYLHFTAKNGRLYNTEGQRYDECKWKITSNLSDGAIGSLIGAGFYLELGHHIAIVLGAEHRFLRFNSLRGPGAIGYPYDSPTNAHPFNAELVKADNYYGTGIREATEDHGYAVEIGLEMLDLGTEPGYEARKPTSLGFSSLGLTLGLQIRLNAR